MERGLSPHSMCLASAALPCRRARHQACVPQGGRVCPCQHRRLQLVLASRLRPEETRRLLEDLVGAMHLTQFLFKPLNLGCVIGGDTGFTPSLMFACHTQERAGSIHNQAAMRTGELFYDWYPTPPAGFLLFAPRQVSP